MAQLALGLTGALRRHTMVASAAAVLGLAWWWQLAALQQPRELVWLGVTAISVLTGFVALGWLRPARVGITAPQAMMLLGTLGMLAGLALDVQQFADARVRRILAKHGWFQTVKSDLPHFTYLGVSEDELPSLGLRREVISGQAFWIPDIKE